MKVEAFANPKVLEWARRMAGLEVEEVARKVGTTAHRLESWEHGQRRPSITQVRKLADIYKRPFALFFLDKPPADDPTPSDFRRFDPRAAEPLSSALRLAIREAHARREAALDLFDELDEEPPQFTLTASLRDNPEVVGQQLREALVNGAPPATGDPRLVFNYWRNSAEGAGVLVFQADDVRVEEMRGFSISERPLPAIVLNIKDSYAARTFSLYHELAHVMLNRAGLCIFEEEGPHTDLQRTEVFCNHVAGAALLPASSLLREPELPAHRVVQIRDAAIREVANRYGTSPEAVLRRLVILGRLPLAFYRRKRQEYARAFERHSRMPREGGFAPPYTMAVATSGNLFTRLVLQAYDDERITSSDVAEHLGVRLKHLDRIRAAVREEPSSGWPA